MSARSIHQSAFTAVDLLVVVAAIALVLGLLLPELARKRARASRISCVNHLKQIGLAYRGWVIDFGDHPANISREAGGSREYTGPRDAFRHFQVLGTELGSPKVLLCPEDKTRSVAAQDYTNGFSNATLGYFINLDVSEGFPGAMLAGDRHLSTNNIIIRSSQLLVTTNTALQWTRDLHKGNGNLLFADGSVMQVISAGLLSHVKASTNETQRLLFP